VCARDQASNRRQGIRNPRARDKVQSRTESPATWDRAHFFVGGAKRGGKEPEMGRAWAPHGLPYTCLGGKARQPGPQGYFRQPFPLAGLAGKFSDLPGMATRNVFPGLFCRGTAGAARFDMFGGIQAKGCGIDGGCRGGPGRGRMERVFGPANMNPRATRIRKPWSASRASPAFDPRRDFGLSTHWRARRSPREVSPVSTPGPGGNSPGTVGDPRSSGGFKRRMKAEVP